MPAAASVKDNGTASIPTRYRLAIREGIMATATPEWVDPTMRVGFTARGAVYVLVGGLAFLAAVDGGTAPGTKGALENLLGGPWGTVLLAAIGIGLFCYAAWRGLCAMMDLESRGDDAKGWAARTGQIASGIAHLGLAVFAVSLVWGSGGGGSGGGQGGGSTEHWTAMLMQQPFGRWLVGILGAVVIGAGAYQFYKAHKEKYKEFMAATRTTERLSKVLKYGLDAHGVVIGIIGGFLIWAALSANPNRAGGVGQVLDTIRYATFGQILLGLMGLGLISFAVYCFVEARYRIVPRLAGSDTATLASKAREAKDKAERGARQMAE
jgi:Na+/proline symporter